MDIWSILTQSFSIEKGYMVLRQEERNKHGFLPLDLHQNKFQMNQILKYVIKVLKKWFCVFVSWSSVDFYD